MEAYRAAHRSRDIAKLRLVRTQDLGRIPSSPISLLYILRIPLPLVNAFEKPAQPALEAPKPDTIESTSEGLNLTPNLKDSIEIDRG